jgi:transcriptional regulator with XRE-family HTH domain
MKDELAGVGTRLRQLRLDRALTLADVSETTGISPSTLSRLESGLRKPTLELLLPLAEIYRVALDDLVGAPENQDPRVSQRPFTRNGRTFTPLSRTATGLQAYKVLIPGSSGDEPVDQRTHEGYDWMYVLHGRLRLHLGEHQVIVSPGEVAEFDTRVPHYFCSADEHQVEILSLFGRQGERMHVRASTTPH